MVDAAANARTVVTFGDSITDGANSTPDANHRWPDILARRLIQAGGTPTAVLNDGYKAMADSIDLKLLKAQP